MKYGCLVVWWVLVAISCGSESKQGRATAQDGAVTETGYALVIHGGAGTLSPDAYTEERKQLYLATLDTALTIGEGILDAGGSALDAVEKTINYMEDNPLFNSGRGAVFAHDGTNQLDASIMQGVDRNAGAVGGVSNVKNPITAARAVMEQSPHVMLVGEGAEAFAAEVGLELVDPSYFRTEQAWDRLQKALAQEKNPDDKHGTVGCVALDLAGNIVAGTSTGGMTNKKYDRIGDSPIIGAGTYADNVTCGVSATGHGEFFIRNTVARDISAMMQYQGSTLQEASAYIIHDVLVKAGGSGGIVALDKDGNISMTFNTSGMYRGYAKKGERKTAIFK